VKRKRNKLLVKSPAVEPSSLKKQSCYGSEPWKPGEVPTRGTIFQIRPTECGTMPYGESMGVHLPCSRGQGKPRKDEA
jgi:hypothetical protein